MHEEHKVICVTIFGLVSENNNFFILFTTGSIVIFHNKSLTPLKIDNNKYADVSTVFLQSSSGQKKEKKKKTKQNNLKNENSEKMFPDHYDQ